MFIAMFPYGGYTKEAGPEICMFRPVIDMHCVLEFGAGRINGLLGDNLCLLNEGNSSRKILVKSSHILLAVPSNWASFRISSHAEPPSKCNGCQAGMK